MYWYGNDPVVAEASGAGVFDAYHGWTAIFCIAEAFPAGAFLTALSLTCSKDGDGHKF